MKLELDLARHMAIFSESEQGDLERRQRHHYKSRLSISSSSPASSSASSSFERNNNNFVSQSKQLKNRQNLSELNANIKLKTTSNIEHDFKHQQERKADPVYLEDQKVFENLILKERREIERTRLASMSSFAASPGSNLLESKLCDQQRHHLLSWMLSICEHQLCQDEVFPLATMILDKFLLFHPIVLVVEPTRVVDDLITTTSDKDNNNNNLQARKETTIIQQQQQQECHSIELYCDEHWAQLRHRQLCLFAACCLLLATKMRQTPRLCVESLIEFSRFELPIELSRSEILDCELLILATLKWDLAALVTPNDYLAILAKKCRQVAANFIQQEPLVAINSSEKSSPRNSKKTTELIENDTPESRERVCFNSETRQVVVMTPNGRRLRIEDDDDEDADADDEHRKQAFKKTRNKRGKMMSVVGQHPESNELNKTTTTATSGCLNICDESRVRQHTQTLLELCLMDAKLSRVSPSILAMSTMAVAIDGLSMTEHCWRLNEIVKQIHESTDKINELEQMIEVSYRVEEYVQKLLKFAHND